MKVIEKIQATACAVAAAATATTMTTAVWQRRLQAIVPLVLVAAVVMVPQLAHAQGQPWESAAKKTYDLIMSIARWVAVIAVVGCGLAAIFGKLSYEWAGKIVIGLVLIFGGTYLVDYFSNGMGAAGG